MTFVDAIILAVLFISALFAFRRGFTRETIAIFAWVGTGAAAYYAFPLVRPYAHAAIPLPLVADILSLFVTFFGFLMVFGIVTTRLADVLVTSNPGMTDRGLGFAYGLARGLILVAGGYWALGLTDPNAPQPDYITEANLFPIVDTTAVSLAAFLPQQGALGAQGVATVNDPAYEAPNGSAEDDGYATSERQALDQLIESTSGD